MDTSVKHFIDYNTDVNLQIAGYCPSPLITALLRFNQNTMNLQEIKKLTNIIKMLIDAGADIHQPCDILENKTPIQLAEEKYKQGLIPEEVTKLFGIKSNILKHKEIRPLQIKRDDPKHSDSCMIL